MHYIITYDKMQKKYFNVLLTPISREYFDVNHLYIHDKHTHTHTLLSSHT